MGEDPYLVADHGCAYVRGLQSAGRDRHPEALRRLLRLPRGPQPRAGVDGPPRADGRGPPAVRGGRHARGRGFGDELLRRRRRHARGRRPLAAHRPCCATRGGSPARWCPTTGRCRSSPPCTGWRADAADAGAQALAAGIDVELPDTIGFAGLRRARAGGARRAGGAADAHAEGGAGAARRGLDAGGLGGGRRRRRPRRARQPRARPRAGRALDRAPRRRARRSPCAPTCGGWRSSGRAPPTRSRSWAATPSPPTCCPASPATGWASTCRPRWTPCAPSCRDAEVVHAPGCAVSGTDRSGFAAAVAAARDAEVCVALVGDRAGLFGHGTSGEGCDAADLRLPGRAGRAARRAARHRHPGGRGRRVRQALRARRRPGRAAGLVQAFMPGEEGGGAIAGVLSGRVQPVGRLPVQIPRAAGGQPSTYLQPPLGGAESAGISSLDATPLFPFGYGRSYTTFAVDDLRISAAELPTDGEIERGRPRAQHRGARGRGGGAALPAGRARAGRAAHAAAGRVRPGAARRRAPPPTSGSASTPTAPRSPGRDLRRIVEPGDIEILVGTSAADLPCRGTVRLTGPLREVGADRQLVTPVDVSARADA